MALKDLRHSEPLFRTLIEHSTDAITLLTQDSTVIYANPSTEQVTGYRPEEFVGTKICHIVCAEDWEHVEWSNLLTRPGDSAAFMLRIRHKNGSWHWMEGTFTNLLNEPTVGALVGNYRDITERKQTEEHLHQSEERYRVLVEQATDGIFLTDHEGNFVDVNAAFCLLAGYTREELLTRTIGDLTRAEDHQRLFLGRDALLSGETLRSQWYIKRKNGSLIRTEFASKQLSNGYLQGFMHDISERIQAEEERSQLLSSEQAARAEAEAARAHLHDLFMQAPAHIAILRGPERRFELVNPLFLQAIGLTEKEVLGKTTKEVIPHISEQGYGTIISKVYATGQPFIGTEMPVQLDRHGDGTVEETFFNFVYQPFYNSQGKVEGVLIHGVEVTHEVHARQHVEKLVQQLKETERRKQEFLGMVSHELRSPLTAILGFIELAQFYLQQFPTNSPSEKNTILSQIETMLVHMNQQVNIECRLVEALLDVARMEMHKFELSLQKHNLAQVVREMVAYQQQITHNRRLELLVLAQEQVSVLIDEDRIGQVLINYLTNALKYSPADKVIQIGLTLEGSSARVFVRDQGPGLTFDQQQSIWERFYQTEPARSQSSEGGLGLGLYIAKIIVQQHGGQVGVESEPGQGSTFWFTLPLIDEPEQS